VEGPALRFVRWKHAIAISALIYAAAAAGAAWRWGRTTIFAAGSPAVTLNIRPQSLALINGRLVASQVDKWRVQVWRIDPAASAAPAPLAIDLAVRTQQAPRPIQKYSNSIQKYPRSAESRGYEKGASSPVQQVGPPDLPLVGSAFASQAAAPIAPAVTVSRDGNTAAWIVGPQLFVTALDREDEPFVSTLRTSGCVPELGDAALVVACRDGRLEIHEIRGRVRGEIQRESPWTLIRDRRSVLAVSGTEVFEIQSAAEPYTRVNAEFAKPPHTLARSADKSLAIAYGDGRITLVPATGGQGVDLTAPGVADAVAFLPDADGVLAGGSFRGIYLLRPGADPQLFAPDIVGTRFLAVHSDRHIAYGTADRVSLAAVTTTNSFDGVGKLLLGLALLFLLGGTADPSLDPEAPRFVLPLPDLPAGLVTACLEGDCVLYAGAGLSAQAGYPTWQPFVEELLTWSRDTGKVDPAFSESLQAALRAGQVDTVGDALVSAIGRDDVMRRLAETFGRPNKPSEAHRFLKRIPLGAVLTTNFDTLLERTYPEAAERVFTPRDAERLVELLGRRDFFIGKLYGTLSVPDSVLFGPAEYAETVARNITFSQFMEGMFVSRTLFFVGASMEGIESYLSGLTFRGQMTRPHYALVAVTDTGWRAKADILRRRYGIEVLPYTAGGPRFEEVSRFLDKLADDTSPSGERPAPAARSGPSDGVRRIQLTNIGPFSKLSLDLQPDWNVILGDNGVGKSSILKALAACFCGTDVEPYGSRLVRRGEPSGSIVLETARNTYRMEIKIKSNGGAAVTVVPTRPLEVEGFLALGFPALRAVSWDRPKGATSEGRKRAAVEDLLPIVKGDPDPRLDRLKQWLVNLDSRINYERSNKGDDRYERLLARFFQIFDDVTPGMAIRFGHVNQDTREVTVVTDDGEIPIELISQGSVSLMGWIGILLQRLYEIYGDDEDPTQRYALVLIDEIDAHMHPEWQQTVVMDMTRIFPNVQFIATTHSPLVVGGMQGRQVTRFVRDQDGHAVSLEVKDDMLVGRADQILTSRLFGMKTTLDQQTQGSMETYKTLLGKKNRTEPEDEQFQRLNKELKFKIPIAEETSPERKAFALVEAIVNDQITGSVPEARQPLLDKARALLDEIAPHDTRAL
jgi:hypothetical protein